MRTRHAHEFLREHYKHVLMHVLKGKLSPFGTPVVLPEQAGRWLLNCIATP